MQHFSSRANSQGHISSSSLVKSTEKKHHKIPPLQMGIVASHLTNLSEHSYSLQKFGNSDETPAQDNPSQRKSPYKVMHSSKAQDLEKNRNTSNPQVSAYGTIIPQNNARMDKSKRKSQVSSRVDRTRNNKEQQSTINERYGSHQNNKFAWQSTGQNDEFSLSSTQHAQQRDTTSDKEIAAQQQFLSHDSVRRNDKVQNQRHQDRLLSLQAKLEKSKGQAKFISVQNQRSHRNSVEKVFRSSGHHRKESSMHQPKQNYETTKQDQFDQLGFGAPKTVQISSANDKGMAVASGQDYGRSTINQQLMKPTMHGSGLQSGPLQKKSFAGSQPPNQAVGSLTPSPFVGDSRYGVQQPGSGVPQANGTVLVMNNRSQQQQQQQFFAGSGKKNVISRQIMMTERGAGSTHTVIAETANQGQDRGMQRQSSMLQQYINNQNSNAKLSDHRLHTAQEEIIHQNQKNSRTVQAKYDTEKSSNRNRSHNLKQGSEPNDARFQGNLAHLQSKYNRQNAKTQNQGYNQALPSQIERQPAMPRPSSINNDLHQIIQIGAEGSQQVSQTRQQRQYAKTTKGSLHNNSSMPQNQAHYNDKGDHAASIGHTPAETFSDHEDLNQRQSLSNLPHRTGGLSMLEMHEQALIQSSQKKQSTQHQQPFFTSNDQPPEQEYGIQMMAAAAVTEPTQKSHRIADSSGSNVNGNLSKVTSQLQALNVNTSGNVAESGETTNQPISADLKGLATQLNASQNLISTTGGGNQPGSAHTSTQNLLPESIFTSLPGKNLEQQLSGQNWQKQKPAWKQMHSHRKSELNSQRHYDNSTSQNKALNTSSERNQNFTRSSRSPYQQITQTQAVTSVASDGNFVGHSNFRNSEQLNQSTRSNGRHQQQQLNNSQSIENERNRIHDMVKSTNFGPNAGIQQTNSQQDAMYGRAESAASPTYLQNAEKSGPFSASKIQQNVMMPKVDEVAQQIQPFNATQSAQKSSSMKGIPKIGNSSTYTTTQQSNSQSLHRSLYQTHQGGKYNFITPMILSDLHQISTQQQSAPAREPAEESKHTSSDNYRNGAAARKEYDASQRKGKSAISDEAKLALRPAHNAEGSESQQKYRNAQPDSFQAMQANSQYGKIRDRKGVVRVGDPASMRPQSGQYRRPLQGKSQAAQAQKNILNRDQNSIAGPVIISGEVNPNSQVPAFVQKNRRLKTPAVYSAQNSNAQNREEEDLQEYSVTGGPNSLQQQSTKNKMRRNLQLQTGLQMQVKNKSGLTSPNVIYENINEQQSPDMANGELNGEEASIQSENVANGPGNSKSKVKQGQHLVDTTSQVDGESSVQSPQRRTFKHKGGAKLKVGKHQKNTNLKAKRRATQNGKRDETLHTNTIYSGDENGDDTSLLRGNSQSSQKRQRLSQSSSKTFVQMEVAGESELDDPEQLHLHQDDRDWSMASIISQGLIPEDSALKKSAVKTTELDQTQLPTQEAVPSKLDQSAFMNGTVDFEKQDLDVTDKTEDNKKDDSSVIKTEELKQKTKKTEELPEKQGYFDETKLAVFNKQTLERDCQSSDPLLFAQRKVAGFLVQNPLNQRFIQKEKGRLPYSVFKPHAQQVTFLKSIFEGRPPVAFFQYPSYVGIKRVADRIRMYTREEVEHLFMSFRISDSTHIYNAVVNSCKAAGFNMLEGNKNDLFNVQWTGYIGANDIKHLNKYQKTNHFPGSTQLGRKDLLWRNMARMRSRFPKDFIIAPHSYLINEEFEAFQAERERDPTALWILKPVAASCGRGIKIVNSQQKVNKREGYLAAKYLAHPHLLNGLKYDLRVYVLVTSFNPLRIYMYNDGLVRFATEKYSNDPRKLQKKFVHLTNFSINKKNLNFVKNTDKMSINNKNKNQNEASTVPIEDEDEQEFDQNSSKWDFKMLRAAYEKHGINYEYVIAQFKDLIVKTLLCVEPHVTQNLQKNPTSRSNCFELYGFDILVDQNYKPWVLEVNVLPSLSSSSPFDKRIKTMLICDTLTLVGIRGYDKQKFHSQTTELLGLAPFAQSMTVSELRQKPRLSGQEKLTRDELEMLMDLDEEFMRRGNFQRIFPLASNASFYEQFFETKRYQNFLCASYLTSPQHIRDQILHKYRRIYNSQV